MDDLLQLREGEATACQEAPINDDSTTIIDPDDNVKPFLGGHQGRMITSTPQAWFMYNKGMKLSELHDDDAFLVFCIGELLFQEGRPLSPIDHSIRMAVAGGWC